MEHFPRYWAFVRGVHRSPVNSLHKDKWRGVLMFSLICAWINGWANHRDAGDLRRHRAHYGTTVMATHHIHTYIHASILYLSLDLDCELAHESDFESKGENLSPPRWPGFKLGRLTGFKETTRGSVSGNLIRQRVLFFFFFFFVFCFLFFFWGGNQFTFHDFTIKP